MNNNKRNLIITIIGAVLIITYLSILNLSKKTVNEQIGVEPVVQSNLNLDSLHVCMEELTKLVDGKSSHTEISGKLNTCSLELKKLFLKKNHSFLPENINLNLTYKVLINNQIKEIQQTKDGIHMILFRSETFFLHHCSSNVVDFSSTEKTVSFIPKESKNFIICLDPASKQSVSYFSTDFTKEEIEDVTNGIILELKKVQNNMNEDSGLIPLPKETEVEPNSSSIEN
jgi:hypothetical protein